MLSKREQWDEILKLEGKIQIQTLLQLLALFNIAYVVFLIFIWLLGLYRGEGGPLFFTSCVHFPEVGFMMHTCEDDLVCKAVMEEKVPYFNAPIYLENKQQIGKVDEIFGPIRDYVSLYLLPYKKRVCVCACVYLGEEGGRWIWGGKGICFLTVCGVPTNLFT